MLFQNNNFFPTPFENILLFNNSRFCAKVNYIITDSENMYNLWYYAPARIINNT